MKWYKVKLISINNKEDIVTVSIFALNAIVAASLATKDFSGYLAFSSDIIEKTD